MAIYCEHYNEIDEQIEDMLEYQTARYNMGKF